MANILEKRIVHQEYETLTILGQRYQGWR